MYDLSLTLEKTEVQPIPVQERDAKKKVVRTQGWAMWQDNRAAIHNWKQALTKYTLSV